MTDQTERQNCDGQADRRLHHIGFVLESISDAVPDFTQPLSCKWDGVITHDPLQKVRVAFLTPERTGEPLLELVEPAGDDSPVQAFLKRGSGLHHLCYEVGNLDLELRRARESGGLTVRPPLPATAFGGRRIAWIYTKSRLLVEYLEK